MQPAHRVGVQPMRRLLAASIGIHWEAIDEDISVASLLRPENFMRLPDKALQPAARKKRAVAGRRSR